VALLGVAAVLLALRAVPSLLKPPEPPPLPADVGLPRIEAAAKPRKERKTTGKAPKPRPPAQRSRRRARR